MPMMTCTRLETISKGSVPIYAIALLGLFYERIQKTFFNAQLELISQNNSDQAMTVKYLD